MRFLKNFIFISGGIKGFAGNHTNVLKWCLNRPHQAKNLDELLQLSGLRSVTECYKPLRQNDINKSESNVKKVINVLENEYLNPFGLNLDSNTLYNLSSGCGKESGVEELLSIWENGKTMAENFFNQRFYSKETLFHDPITRNKIPTFQAPKVKLSTNKATKVIDANRNIIGKLITLTAKTLRPIDFEEAFCYPLYGVPLSLAYPDGSRRETQKSKLLEVIAPSVQPYVDTEIDRDQCVYIVDMVSQIRICSTNVPDTFEEFILKFLQSIAKGYHRVDLVADTYRDTSIKNQEREKRGISTQILIGSVFSKLPCDINRFLKNNENKTNLINLIFKYVIDNKEIILEMMQTQRIILSGDNECFDVSSTSVIQSNLQSNQEEADTKVILHAFQAMTETNRLVHLRSPSGDTDILVLSLGLITDRRHLERIYYDYGNGKNRKGTWLSKIPLDDTLRDALVGFHAFTGNDYISTLFRKGKKMCWSTMTKNEAFVGCFTELGRSWSLTDDIQRFLEQYVCKLYGSKKKSVNAVRFELFTKKFTNANKAIDLSVLPPCHSSLILHAKRANFIAAMWKRTKEAIIEMPPITDHGWNDNGSIEWIDKPYPDDITEMLIEDNGEEEETVESDIDSESDNNDDNDDYY